MKRLGKTQQSVLRAVRDHKEWHVGSGWLWDTRSGTERVLETLVKHGLVTKTETETKAGTRMIYRPVEGKKA